MARKQIDIESATRDIPHYALMEEAWGYYRQARAGLQDPTDRQQAVGSDTKAPNDQSPATQEMLDKIKELADQFAQLQNTIERDRAERARTAPARSKRARKACSESVSRKAANGVLEGQRHGRAGLEVVGVPWASLPPERVAQLRRGPLARNSIPQIEKARRVRAGL